MRKNARTLLDTYLLLGCLTLFHDPFNRRSRRRIRRDGGASPLERRTAAANRIENRTQLASGGAAKGTFLLSSAVPSLGLAGERMVEQARLPSPDSPCGGREDRAICRPSRGQRVGNVILTTRPGIISTRASCISRTSLFPARTERTEPPAARIARSTSRC